MPLSRDHESTTASDRHDEAIARLTEELRQAGFAGLPPDAPALAARHGVSEEAVRRCLAAIESMARAARAPGTLEEIL